MQKTLHLIFLFLLLFFFISCKKAKPQNEPQEVINVVENEIVSAGISVPEENPKINSKKIDVDFSTMNYNILAGVTFDLLVTPEKYVNKRAKISGYFYHSFYEDREYFSVIIWDNTGCCPAGLDFIPPKEMNYPEDFPADEEKITVTGVFKFSEEGNKDYLEFMAEEIIKN